MPISTTSPRHRHWRPAESGPSRRRVLAREHDARLHFAPDDGHMLINQQPDWVAELIVDAVARYGDQTRQDARSRTARSTLR